MNRRLLAGLAVLGLLLAPMQGQAQIGDPGFGSGCSLYVVRTSCHFTKRLGVWLWVSCDPYWQLGCVPGDGQCFEALHFPAETITVRCQEFVTECPPNGVGGFPFDVQVAKTWCDLTSGPLGPS